MIIKMDTQELIKKCLSDNYIPYLDLFNEVEQITSNFDTDKTIMLSNEINSHVECLPIAYRYEFLENGVAYSRTEQTTLGFLYRDHVNNTQVYDSKNVDQMITCVKIMGVEVYTTRQISNFQQLQNIILTKEKSTGDMLELQFDKERKEMRNLLFVIQYFNGWGIKDGVKIQLYECDNDKVISKIGDALKLIREGKHENEIECGLCDFYAGFTEIRSRLDENEVVLEQYYSQMWQKESNLYHQESNFIRETKIQIERWVNGIASPFNNIPIVRQYLDFLEAKIIEPPTANTIKTMTEYLTEKEKMLRELGIYNQIFQAQLINKESQSLNFPLVINEDWQRADGVYFFSFTIKSMVEIGINHLQKYEDVITQRFECANDKTLIKAELIEIKTKAQKILEFYNQNLTNTSHLGIEANKQLKQSNNTEEFLEKHRALVVVDEGYCIEHIFVGAENVGLNRNYNFYNCPVTNEHVVNNCLRLINFIRLLETQPDIKKLIPNGQNKQSKPKIKFTDCIINYKDEAHKKAIISKLHSLLDNSSDSRRIATVIRAARDKGYIERKGITPCTINEFQLKCSKQAINNITTKKDDVSKIIELLP
jgi:hypothetical protein